MDLPIDWPLSPMLAKAVPTVPAPESVDGGLAYEPKWDGFRCLVARSGDEIDLGSRGSKPLTRYFPEVVEAVREFLPAGVVLDGELIVRRGEAGSQRLDWEALAQRIHPAQSRITRLAAETPAEFVAFDLVVADGESWLDKPFHERRARLEALFAEATSHPSIHLTRLTRDEDEAQGWFEEFEGAGLDGVVAKPLAAPYAPGKRSMLKIKHKRTAEAVVYGYRVHKSGDGVGSLLLGLHHDGQLVPVGGIVALPDATRRALVAELAPLVRRNDDGTVDVRPGERSRFSAPDKDTSLVVLDPVLVVEVAFDQLEGHRFRHAVTFLRWRPDRDAASCTLDQVDRAPDYDLGRVFAG